MGLLARLFGPRADDHAEVRALWLRTIALAREPQWYARGGIADTVAGRFDALSLVMALVLLRMEQVEDLRAVSARLTELFVTDMDGQLREQGVGDLVVGKRIGKLMGALGGRIEACRAGLAATDDRVLADAVERNVTLGEQGEPVWIAAELRRLAGALAAADSAALLAGRIER